MVFAFVSCPLFKHVPGVAKHPLSILFLSSSLAQFIIYWSTYILKPHLKRKIVGTQSCTPMLRKLIVNKNLTYN